MNETLLATSKNTAKTMQSRPDSISRMGPLMVSPGIYIVLFISIIVNMWTLVRIDSFESKVIALEGSIHELRLVEKIPIESENDLVIYSPHFRLKNQNLDDSLIYNDTDSPKRWIETAVISRRKRRTSQAENSDKRK